MVLTRSRTWVFVFGVLAAEQVACSSSAPNPTAEASTSGDVTERATTETSAPSTTKSDTSMSSQTSTNEHTSATASADSSTDDTSPGATVTSDERTDATTTESETSTSASETETSEPTSTGEVVAGTCTPSVPTGARAQGTGPYEVVVETNSDPGINEGTIFRPASSDGSEKFPIFVWGQGGCSQNGMSNATAMTELASHGYFVIADGTPNGSGNRTMDRSNLAAMGEPLVAYVDWAIAENAKPCSAYYQTLDPSKVSANGFSCGGLMSQAMVLDPRIVTWGVNSSGMAGADQAFYDAIHTPVLFVEGGPEDVAYDGGLEGYETIVELGVPVMWFDTPLGHGGDLFDPDGGDFTKINLAWLNWWLKDDEGATGKGALVGAGCAYCSDANWDVRSANLP